QVDRRADIFSMGACMWEMAVGRRLFRRDSEMATLTAVMEEATPLPSRFNPTFPPELERIIMRALEKDAAARFPTARDMQVEIEALARQSGWDAGTVEVGAYVRRIFADKLASREKLAREQRVASFERLLLDERTQILDTQLAGKDDAEIDVAVDFGAAPALAGDARARVKPRVEGEPSHGSGSKLTPAPHGQAVSRTEGRVPGRGSRARALLGAALVLGLAAGLLWVGRPYLFPGMDDALLVGAASEPAGTTGRVDGAGAAGPAESALRVPAEVRLPRDKTAAATRAAADGPATDSALALGSAATGADVPKGKKARRGAGAPGAGMARLSVDVDTHGGMHAVVWLDGRMLGPTPLAAVEVRAGRHTLTLKGEGGKSKTVPIVLRPGQRFSKRYVLE
ncbi:MAG TPA: PEGA domain-containing protein, partial [Myxococcota bacterium]|nr:PEGA domain-containing protein [Myxococcota bacterium]